MFYLSLEERIELARFTVEAVKGRLPVVASGHVSERFEDQRRELAAMASTGVDGLVLVTNRLAPPEGDSQALRDHLDGLLNALPADLPLGLYECPAPYRRLLTDPEVDYCAQTGRFAMIKDVSCDLRTVKRRIGLAKGSPLGINNANAAIAWPALKAGASGFCGVMTNLHPDLYRWLQDHGPRYPDLAEELARFLVLAAMSESMGYPKLAKIRHQRIGTFAHDGSRAVTYDVREKHWAFDEILDQIETGAEQFRARIAKLGTARL
jgi:4-hydroxy-tetrahydrodipicolinate synthase